MHVCLKCNAKRRGKKDSYPCPNNDCLGTTVEISRRMLHIAHLFYNMGYRIYSAKDCIDHKKVDNSYWISVCVEFSQIYPPEAFPDLPVRMAYNRDLSTGRCQLIYKEVYLITADTVQEVKNVIRKLEHWALDLAFEDLPDLFRLFGYFDIQYGS